MKNGLSITFSEYKHVRTDVVRMITNIKNEIPVWMYKHRSGDTIDNYCPICRQEMNKQISHGVSIEICSVIELDHVKVIPIHTECLYEMIKDQNYDPVQKNPEMTILHFDQNQK